MTDRSGEDDGLLDVREAARLARRTPETVRRWVWSGRLEARRHGKRLLVRRADVIALAQAGGGKPALTLAEWAQTTAADLERSRGVSRRSAADLVLESRRARSNSS